MTTLILIAMDTISMTIMITMTMTTRLAPLNT
jgi:hypothetical protein